MCLENTSILTGIGLVRRHSKNPQFGDCEWCHSVSWHFIWRIIKVRLSMSHHYILGSNVYIPYLSNVEFTMISYQEITAIFLYLNGWITWRQTSTTTWVKISPIAIVTNIEIHLSWFEFNLILSMEIESLSETKTTFTLYGRPL